MFTEKLESKTLFISRRRKTKDRGVTFLRLKSHSLWKQRVSRVELNSGSSQENKPRRGRKRFLKKGFWRREGNRFKMKMDQKKGSSLGEEISFRAYLLIHETHMGV